jgi:uncharacterized protein (TIGR02996 family)
MTTTREALEAALVRNPDDVSLHMAYADCLIEEGDPRGEWIRLCLEKERPDLDAAAKRKLGTAIRRLRSTHGARWESGLAPHVFRWRRGWVHHFQATGDLDPTIMYLFRSHPCLSLVQTVALNAMNGAIPNPPDTLDYSALRHCRWSNLRRLEIWDRTFRDDGIAQLLDSPWFPRLESLSLEWCGLTEGGIVTLAKHPHTRRLKGLSLEGNEIGPASLDALTEAFGGKVAVFRRMPVGRNKASLMNELIANLRPDANPGR